MRVRGCVCRTYRRRRDSGSSSFVPTPNIVERLSKVCVVEGGCWWTGWVRHETTTRGTVRTSRIVEQEGSRSTSSNRTVTQAAEEVGSNLCYQLSRRRRRRKECRRKSEKERETYTIRAEAPRSFQDSTISTTAAGIIIERAPVWLRENHQQLESGSKSEERKGFF